MVSLFYGVSSKALEQDAPSHISAKNTISFYNPTYIMPLFYVFSPYNAVYQNNTPDQEKLRHADFKYQFSLKIPIIRSIFGENNILYAAYTQRSYWQAYNSSPFFRETNYEPEVFLAHKMHITLPYGWYGDFINVGLAHQSNGRGGALERSWNRAYVEAIFTKDNRLMVSLKPWLIIHDASLQKHNADIAYYLGYGRAIAAYKHKDNTFSLEFYDVVESGFKRGSIQLSWSFPLLEHIRGYIQFFNGYGESLIEYEHRTNSMGIGLSLSDWM